MSLPPLRLKIDADTSGLEKSIDKVQGELSGLERATDGIARGLGNFGDKANQLGRRMLPLSAGITAAAGGAFMLARGTALAGDEVAKAARAAGVATDDFQELRFAMGQVAGMSDGEFASSLQYLNRQMGEAAGGNERAADALAAVGVSLQDVQSGAVTAADVMQAFADNAGQFETSAEAAQVAAALFGRSGSKLGSILRESGDEVAGLRDRAQELGIVLGGDVLNSSEAFNDKMDELQKQIGAAKNEIGQALLPVALSLATTFQDKVVPAIISVAEGIGNAIEWFGKLPGPVQEAASVIATALGAGGPVLIAIGAMSKALGALVAATGPIGLLIAAAALLTTAWMKWGDDIKEIVGGAVDWITDKFTEFVEFVKSIPSMMYQIGAEIIDQLIEGVKSGIERLRQVGADIANGLTEGIRGAAGRVRDAASGMASSAADAVTSLFRTQSPSRLMMEIGENVAEGLAIGIESTAGLAVSAMDRLGNMVSSSAFGMANDVVDAMGQMFAGSKPIAAAQALINTFQGITEALKLPFPANLAAAARVAAQGFAAVRGIQSARPGSSGGGASGGGAAQAQPAPIPVQRMIIETQGGGMIQQSQLSNIIDQINEAGRQGRRIDAQFIGGMA